MSGLICWRIAQRDKRCWQPAVRGSQMDMSCLLLSLHGFVSSVCWQSPLGAQIFKSVFCHGLSSFCYTRVTTILLFPLCSSLCWLRASFSLSGTLQASFTTFPTPVLNLGFLHSGKTSPTQAKSCVWHLTACSHTAYTSVEVPVAAQGGSNWEKKRVWASSDFTGRLVWFSSLADSRVCVFNSPCSCWSLVLQALSLSVCRNVMEQNQPSLTPLPQLVGVVGGWRGVVSQLNRSTYLGIRV